MANKKKFLKGVGGLLILGAIGLTLKVYLAKNEFLYAGTLEATHVDLSSRLSSIIEKINVREGDYVLENQELVTLSCDDLAIDARWANENFQRTFRLFKVGSASKEAMQEAKNKKDDLDVRLKWCAIRAPISGVTLNRYREPGEWVGPGTKILTLANVKDIWASIYVPQPQIAKLKVGMTLQGYIPELGHKVFRGKIIKISDEAEFTPKNVQTQSERTRLIFGVKISFLNANNEEILKPGMTIEVKLPLD